MKTVHEVLVDARNRLATPDGWWRSHGDEGCAPDALCAGLAIDVEAEHDIDLFKAACRVLAQAVPLPHADAGGIYQWNDKQESVAPILAAFDEAINATSPPPPDLQLSELVEAATA